MFFTDNENGANLSIQECQYVIKNTRTKRMNCIQSSHSWIFPFFPHTGAECMETFATFSTGAPSWWNCTLYSCLDAVTQLQPPCTLLLQLHIKNSLSRQILHCSCSKPHTRTYHKW